MKRFWALLAFAAVCAALLPLTGSTQQAQNLGALKIQAQKIELGQDEWIASGGRPEAYTVDGRFSIVSDQVVVDFNTWQATATGSVRIRIVPDDGRTINITAGRVVAYIDPKLQSNNVRRIVATGGRPSVRTEDGVFAMVADRLDANFETWKIQATGTVRADGVTADGNPFKMAAGEVVADVSPNLKSGQILRAVAAGGVTVDTVTAEKQPLSGTSDRAEYTAEDEKVVFSGNVTAVVSNPSLAEPGRLSAAKATLWLDPQPGQKRLIIVGGEDAPAELRARPKESQPEPEESQ